MLVHVDFAESYRNDQQNEIKSTYFGNQSFSLFTLCCYFKGVTSEIRNKCVAAATEKSDHNRITSMSCLKKVIDTVETECGKSFTNVVLWSDGTGTQFWSRFIFQLLAETIFLNKSLLVRDTMTKSQWMMLTERSKSQAKLWSIHPKNFLMLPWNLSDLLLLCTCPNWTK